MLHYARKNGNSKAAAKAMAAGFSGHSLRAGFVTTAARQLPLARYNDQSAGAMASASF
jgi:hypothetical protein